MLGIRRAAKDALAILNRVGGQWGQLLELLALSVCDLESGSDPVGTISTVLPILRSTGGDVGSGRATDRYRS